MNNIKESGLIKKIKCAVTSSRLTAYLVPLFLLSAYLVYLIANGTLSEPHGYYVLHYLYTYDYGFISRGLVGEILSWFLDTVTPLDLKIVLIVCSSLLVVASSLCMGYALNKTKGDRERHNMVMFIIILLCVLPITYRAFLPDSKLDKILWFITFFAVLFSERKYGIWLTIPLCLIATLINPVFLFCSMILISIILLQKLYDSRYSKKNLAICIIAYVSMIVLGIWSAVSEKLLDFSDGVEMVNTYFARYSQPISADEANWFARECLFDYFEPVDKAIKLAYQIYGIEWGQMKMTVLNFVFLALPFYALLVLFWRAAIKAEENKFQKFVFFLCAVSPIVTFLPILISWESSKYFGNNIIVQLCLIVYYLVHNNFAIVAAVRKAVSWCKAHWLFSAIAVTYLSLFTTLFN